MAPRDHGELTEPNAGAEQLILAIAERGDRTAFARLFTVFAPRVKGYLLGLGTSHAAAEELAQETLLTVWRKSAAFDPARAGASTWIFTIARNLRIDAARREKTALAYQVSTFVSEEDEAPRADGLLEEGERAERVRAALARLPEEQREVVRLSFFQGQAQSEIAEALDLPLGTVKSRVRLAFGRLRALLEDLA